MWTIFWWIWIGIFYAKHSLLSYFEQTVGEIEPLQGRFNWDSLYRIDTLLKIKSNQIKRILNLRLLMFTQPFHTQNSHTLKCIDLLNCLSINWRQIKLLFQWQENVNISYDKIINLLKVLQCSSLLNDGKNCYHCMRVK